MRLPTDDQIRALHEKHAPTPQALEVVYLDLPEADYVATTPEEELVMYADKFHTKSTPPSFVTADAYAAHVARFGEEKVTAFQALRARYGEPDLAALQSAEAPSTAPAAAPGA
ncbi:hypothetical protein [Streptomyces sp. NPDC049555]|uniref:hypothetical protein n=1 Tax=Streptomyces sp. NPDC049555 TaxID=3154930 RepID=UPI0034178B07